MTFTRSGILPRWPARDESGQWQLDLDEHAVGVGTLHPKKGVIARSDMAGISFDSATMKKSRAGKVVMFGVFFTLAAKSTQSAAEITAQLRDGNVALLLRAGQDRGAGAGEGAAVPYPSGSTVP